MRISVLLCLLQQCLCSAVILAAAGRLNGLPPPGVLRRTVCALSGGAAGLLALLLPVSYRMLCLPPVLLLPCLAWPGLTLPRLLRLLPCQLLLMWLLGGMVGTGLQYLPAALTLCAALTAICRLPLWQKAQPAARYAWLSITHQGRSLQVTALIDSGNLLRDEVTGLPVIVLSQSAARRLICLPPPGQLLPGMRYLPVRTATGAACMVMFRPQRIMLRQRGQTLPVQAMLAISPDAAASFSALAPSCLSPCEEVHHPCL